MPSADRLLRLLVLPGVFLLLATGIRPELAGVYGDDVVYLSTGQSLAAGLGPRVPELPGAPLLAKYPPLFGWLLSLFPRLGLDLATDRGVAAVMVLSALAWAAAVDRLVNGLLPARGASPTERLLVALLCGVNTLLVATVPTAMTEGLYTLVLVLQLGAVGPALAGLSALGGGLRSAGLVLNLAVAPGGRRWLPVLVGTAVAVGLTSLARRGVPPAPDFLYYFADYRTHTAGYAEAWGSGGAVALLGRVAEVARVNAVLGASSLGELIFPLRTGGGVGDPWPYGVGLGLLAVGGLARRAPALLAPVLVNTALFVVWTWPFAPRFWLPVFPLVAAGAVLGLGSLGRVGRLVQVPVVALFLVGNGIVPGMQAWARLAGGTAVSAEEARLTALERWLDGALGPGDVLVGGSESLWLARRHGFQAIPLKCLLPREVMLAASLGMPGPAGSPAEGLAGLRAALPGARVWIVLPAGSAPPVEGLAPRPDCPEGYRAWVIGPGDPMGGLDEENPRSSPFQ